MKEIIYKCDICMQERDKEDLVPYFINSKGYINISGSIEEESKHICKICVDMIYAYKDAMIEKKRNDG